MARGAHNPFIPLQAAAEGLPPPPPRTLLDSRTLSPFSVEVWVEGLEINLLANPPFCVGDRRYFTNSTPSPSPSINCLVFIALHCIAVGKSVCHWTPNSQGAETKQKTPDTQGGRMHCAGLTDNWVQVVFTLHQFSQTGGMGWEWKWDLC